MKMINTTPVVVLGGKLGGLSIVRTLGKLGVEVHVFDEDRSCPAFLSKYCKTKMKVYFNQENPERYLQKLISFADLFSEKPVLIPTSDELSIFVSEQAEKLKSYFKFHSMPVELVYGLASKKSMLDIATEYGVPTATAVFPTSIEEVADYAKDAVFPVMLKGIFGNRLHENSGKKMIIIQNEEDLIAEYEQLAGTDAENLFIQDYIPGGDDQVYIFNGYFNNDSDCLAAFTGKKVRQFPIHVGCASLGECCRNDEVSDITRRFMKQIGYRGVLDIGYRYDERDGLYKVLDINPRVGQAFRLFTDKCDLDVVRALYLDLTGQTVPHCEPRDGRRWMIEDFDIISTFHYMQEGTLKPNEWIRSFHRLEESLWFDAKDPVPFSFMMLNLSKRALQYIAKRAFV